MINFSGNQEQLRTEFRGLLNDRQTLEFICRRYFRQHDTEGSGAITLPAVAPLIHNVLRAMGRPTSSDAVYGIWRAHCDPTMNHMTLENFAPFVSKLFENYIEDYEHRAAVAAAGRTVVHLPTVAPPSLAPEDRGRPTHFNMTTSAETSDGAGYPPNARGYGSPLPSAMIPSPPPPDVAREDFMSKAVRPPAAVDDKQNLVSSSPSSNEPPPRVSNVSCHSAKHSQPVPPTAHSRVPSTGRTRKEETVQQHLGQRQQANRSHQVQPQTNPCEQPFMSQGIQHSHSPGSHETHQPEPPQPMWSQSLASPQPQIEQDHELIQQPLQQHSVRSGEHSDQATAYLQRSTNPDVEHQLLHQPLQQQLIHDGGHVDHVTGYSQCPTNSDAGETHQHFRVNDELPHHTEDVQPWAQISQHVDVDEPRLPAQVQHAQFIQDSPQLEIPFQTELSHLREGQCELQQPRHQSAQQQPSSSGMDQSQSCEEAPLPQHQSVPQQLQGQSLQGNDHVPQGVPVPPSDAVLDTDGVSVAKTSMGVVPQGIVQDVRRSPPPPKGKRVQSDPSHKGKASTESDAGAPLAKAVSSGRAPAMIIQDARRSPPPPKTKGVAPATKGQWQAAAATDEKLSSAQGAARESDMLTDAFARLPTAAHEFGQAKRSDAFALDPNRDYFGACSTILTSFEAALHRAYTLIDGLQPGSFFEDPDFGPSATDSCGSRAMYRQGDACIIPKLPAADDVVWDRPTKDSQTYNVVGEFNSVKPGIFNDGWLLDALSMLALQGPAIFGSETSGHKEPLGLYPRLFWDPHLRQRGLFCFRFNKFGQWLYVIVDDRLPNRRQDASQLCAQAVGPDGISQLMWAPLVEKAYAKLHNGYSALWSGLCDDALEELTSWPTDVVRVAKYLGDGKTSARDPNELWELLVEELQKGATIACSKVDTKAAAAELDEHFGQLVQVDARLIGLPPAPAFGDNVSTGLLRSTAYAILAARKVPTRTSAGEPLQLLRLRDSSAWSEGWRGRWADDAEEWLEELPTVASELQVTAGSRFLVPCGRQNSQQLTRPQLPLWTDGCGNKSKEQSRDGTFVIRFDDWLQVFSHVLVSRPLEERLGWAKVCLAGCWTSRTCGGTPIPVRQPVLASCDDWGRNPQCRLVLTGDREVEVCASLLQPDARLHPGSAFPFEDRLLELFLCISQLDHREQRLTTFDKRRVVKPPALIKRRKSVHLQNRLQAPGVYAFVPSTWEVQLPQGKSEAPFRLVLYLRCPPDSFNVEVASTEGWSVLEAPAGTVGAC